ncbi:leucyl aminopeptidase [Roseomonas marmotae]|uniref:Probable cytosol aminopeptidase n=1 Tax=Roseomonas marmotae TaxID=2768161 RepID=A0ABS3K6I9_9PROT|nr:leucyl aminopeptidase [Roseomonas marmotae]MBO1073063.1 leucyl aminopeptidase [Roseomonas marmotae]QTI79292.1 leucyl aminopeptidase [Roseomonas marmotae]
MTDILFVKPVLPRAGALVLPLAEGFTLDGLAKQADEATGGAISRGLEAAGFKGKKGQATTLWAPGGHLSRVVAVGLGAPGGGMGAAEAAGGAALPLIASEVEATVAAESLPAEEAAGLALALRLRGYRFDRYRTKESAEDKPKLVRVTIAVPDVAAAKAAHAPLSAIADGVFLTRDLVSEPPNVLYPAEMAERCRGLEKLGVTVEVLGPAEMEKLGFGALLGVAQGSAREARMVVMQWKGAADDAQPVAFIGKGVTFDTGGISIKPAGGMEDMKYDMAGAGTVIGLMAALAGRKAKVNAVGLVGLVENMPSHNAQRPGDVVTTCSGQTVEVINTDAEGRLVLADVLWYAQHRFKPRFMVDLATLTGAIVVALGHEHAGMFSNDDTLATQLSGAGQAVGEKVWRMPLGEAYDKALKSDIADMKNVGGRPGGSITAAQFLQRFIDTKDGAMPWAHLDIAGTAWASKDGATVPKGATAFGVRLLDRLVAEHYEG